MEECRKTSGIQVSDEPLELSVGGVWKLQLLSWVAQGCFGDTPMQAPLVATRAAARPDATTRGHIHPPLDLAPDEVDTHGLTPVALAKEVCIYLEGVVFSMWRWTEIDVTLGLASTASRNKE